jgi:hypothetical protein
LNIVRYILALVVIIGFPVGLLLWFAIHPFAGFWRRWGPGWTYSLLLLPSIAFAWFVFRAREYLLAVDFGTSYPLFVPAALCLIGSVWIGLRRRKLLTFGILAGLPELSARRYPGKLLTEGIYAKVRHPRYVEALLGVAGYALIANFLASYFVFLLGIPVLYVVVILEERELHQRFGAEYERYRREVPRFVPRAGVGR